MDCEIRLARGDDARAVSTMLLALTHEISTAVGGSHFDLSIDRGIALFKQWLAEDHYVALIAQAADEPVGFAGLSVGHALYAGGRVGTLQEFYVVPRLRGHGAGRALLDRAAEMGRARGWQRLEVCTPPLPAFDRTVAFYERNGFSVTGGRKLRRLIPALDE